jgi:hypothetical protein
MLHHWDSGFKVALIQREYAKLLREHVTQAKAKVAAERLEQGMYPDYATRGIAAVAAQPSACASRLAFSVTSDRIPTEGSAHTFRPRLFLRTQGYDPVASKNPLFAQSATAPSAQKPPFWQSNGNSAGAAADSESIPILRQVWILVRVGNVTLRRDAVRVLASAPHLDAIVEDGQ